MVIPLCSLCPLWLFTQVRGAVTAKTLYGSRRDRISEAFPHEHDTPF